jgi:methylmalonyl-CoA mutase N-terminal domain/subunit
MDAEEIEAGRERWQRRYDASAVRDADFTTLSGASVDPVYGPPDGADVPGFERIGWPGEYPYTRGLYPTGYRGRTWTIRQFAGFGNAEQTNERPLRRGDRLRGRHGGAVPGHSAGGRDDQHDDLRPGGAGVLHVSGRR